jgi:hypothetical protein
MHVAGHAACAVLLALSLAPTSSVPLAFQDQTPTIQISYESFIALDLDARAERFREVNPETKAHLMRTHAERWLAANRERLSAGQIELVQEVIAFIIPEHYATDTEEEARRSRELEEKLRCRLRYSDIMTAFKLTLPPPEASWTRDVQFWLSACLFGG